MFKEQCNLILPDAERIKLKAEFDQLTTIDQKYGFWKNRFNFDYSSHYILEQISIADFIISPRNSTETEELNRRIYNHSFISLGNFEKENPDKMKEVFFNKITTSKNKEALIEYELKNIDDYINRLKHPQSDNTGLLSSSYNPFWSKFFFTGYEEYIFNQKEFDWSVRLYSPTEIYEISLGIEWAKYRDFVKNYLAPKKQRREIILNGEQKFLVLYYLEFGNEVNPNTIKSKLYECFIPELKSNSIRPMFSDITKYETEDNLNTIIDLFRSLKLDSKAREIEDKLPKKNKSKKRN